MARVNTKRVSLVTAQLELDAEREFEQHNRLHEELEYPYDPFEMDWVDHLWEERYEREQREAEAAYYAAWEADYYGYVYGCMDSMLDPL